MEANYFNLYKYLRNKYVRIHTHFLKRLKSIVVYYFYHSYLKHFTVLGIHILYMYKSLKKYGQFLH